ncbi:hypothetical protein ACHAWF_009314 [Thalassiosira exigua]
MATPRARPKRCSRRRPKARPGRVGAPAAPPAHRGSVGFAEVRTEVPGEETTSGVCPAETLILSKSLEED